MRARLRPARVSARIHTARCWPYCISPRRGRRRSVQLRVPKRNVCPCSRPRIVSGGQAPIRHAALDPFCSARPRTARFKLRGPPGPREPLSHHVLSVASRLPSLPCLASHSDSSQRHGSVPGHFSSSNRCQSRTEQGRMRHTQKRRGAGDQHFNPLQGPGIRVPSGMDRAARCSVQELALLIALLFCIYVCPSLACPDAKYASNRPRGARVDPGSLPRATPP